MSIDMRCIRVVSAIAVAAMMIAVPVSASGDSLGANIPDSGEGASFTASGLPVERMHGLINMEKVYWNLLSALGFNIYDYAYFYEDTGSRDLGVKVTFGMTIDKEGNKTKVYGKEYDGYVSFTATIVDMSPEPGEFFNTACLSDEEAAEVSGYFGTPVIGDRINVSGYFDIASASIKKTKYERVDNDGFINTGERNREYERDTCDLRGDFNGRTFRMDNTIKADVTTMISTDFMGEKMKDVQPGTPYTRTTVVPGTVAEQKFTLGDRTYVRVGESPGMKYTEECEVYEDDIRTSESLRFDGRFDEDELRVILGCLIPEIRLADYGDPEYDYAHAEHVMDMIVEKGSVTEQGMCQVAAGLIAAAVVMAIGGSVILIRRRA